MRKDLVNILSSEKIQHRVVALLIGLGYAELKEGEEYIYKNLKFTKEGRDLISSSVVIDPEFIKEFRSLFPPGKKSSETEVTDKMRVLFLEYPNLEPEKVIEATNYYLSTVSEQTFCEKAGNFISKQLKSGATRSTLREFLQELEDG